MTDFDFLLQLRNKGIKLRAEGNRLICNAPKGSLTPELRNMLKEREGEMLAIIRQTEISSRIEAPPIPKVRFDSNPPLSYAQERLWFLEQLQPGNSAYNMSWAFRIEGKLHTEELENSLNEVIKRHEALRTTFSVVDGKPVQVIAPSLQLKITLADFTIRSNPVWEDELCRILELEAKQPFNFEDGPLIRASLFQIDEKKYIFFFMIHHIVFDGWSYDIFMTELFSFYGAFVSKQACPLPLPPIQYADYAYWQKQLVPEERYTRQLAYWKNKLAGVQRTNLPLDYARPSLQTFRGAQEVSALSSNLIESLKELGRLEGVSFFIVLLSGFKILLSRHSGQNDICVGIPSAGRMQKETESLIGFFVHTLPLRTDLSGTLDFREAIRRVRDVLLEAQSNQDVPFERIVKELAPERTLGNTPIFQIFFNHITTQLKSRGEISDISVERFMPYQGESDSKFDLTFYVEEISTNVRLRIVYNADLFSSMRIAEMLKQYELLLEHLVKEPDENPIGHSLVTPAGRDVLPDPVAPVPTESIPLTRQGEVNRTALQNQISEKST